MATRRNAWHDRHIETNRDAEDIAYIISNYLEINEERAASENYDLYEVEDFSRFIAGASLLGRDVKEILKQNPEIQNEFIAILRVEVSKQEDSPLINQIMETHASLKYEDVYKCLWSLMHELNK